MGKMPHAVPTRKQIGAQKNFKKARYTLGLRSTACNGPSPREHTRRN